MPVQRCEKDGLPGWKWGEEGFCYTGQDARELAARQGRAIEAAKMHDSVGFETRVDIEKFDDAEHLVFGWASVSTVDGELVVDSHGDTIELAELEKAAYEFAVSARESGDMHKGEAFGEMVESLVVTPEKLEKMGLQFSDGQPERLGWWIGFRLPPDEFAKVRTGERPAFSIQGRAIREDVE